MAGDTTRRDRERAAWRLMVLEAQLAITRAAEARALLQREIERSKQLIAAIEQRLDDG